MFKGILLIVMSFITVAFAIADDKQTCQTVYRGVQEYRAIAHGRLWYKFTHNELTFEQYREAITESVVPTDDNLWRVNRYSHLGTAAQCIAEGQKAKDQIDRVLVKYSNETNTRN